MGKRERDLQNLICYHPYLLDSDLVCCGEKEVYTSGGRMDIVYHLDEGTVVVECKITPLTERDVRQLKHYVLGLRGQGKTVLRSYLVGPPAKGNLDWTAVNADPAIIVKELIKSIPSQLSLCCKGHYFATDLHRCPYDGEGKIVGKDIVVY